MVTTLIFPVYAQQKEKTESPIAINTDLVITWADVVDSTTGASIKGLRENDFLLREDGSLQSISMVKEGGPLSVVILAGGLGCSINPNSWRITRIKDALMQLGKESEIAIITWHYDAALIQPLTSDLNRIAYVMENNYKMLNERIPPSICDFMTPTAINDPEPDVYLNRPGEAVYQALRYLETNSPQERRKVIIVLTEPQWISRKHSHTNEEVIELIDKTNTTIYALFEEHRSYGNNYSGEREFYKYNKKDKQRWRGGLSEDFVEYSGGSVFVGEQNDTDELFMKLTRLISSSYTIGYYPENSNFDGKFRHINLELNNSVKAKFKNVKINARSGYKAIRKSNAPPN